MATASICALHPGYSHLSLVSPEGSSRSAGGSNSGFFQITASVLVLEHVRFCSCPLGAIFSCNPSALQYTSPTVLKPRCSGSYWLWGRISRLESPTWGLDPLLLGSSIRNFDYPSISGLYSRMWVLTSTISLLLLLVLLQSLLYFFSWGKSVRLQVVFINSLLCK